MRGTWFVKIGSWIARKETFERMVAPAIADMQVEASYGRLHRGKHYFAIGLVLVHALLQDMRLDFASAFDTEARRLAWRRAAIWYAGFVAVFTFLGLRYNLPEGLSLEGIWPAALTSAALEGLMTGVPLGIAVGVFYLYLRSSSRRSIVVVSLIAAALTIAFGLSVRPIRMSADRTVYNNIQARLFSGGQSHYRDETVDEQITWWQDIQGGVSVIPYALIGIVLAKRRGWKKVGLTVIGFFASWFLAVMILHSLHPYPPPFLSLIMQRWRDIALVLTVAVLWLTFDRLFRREQPAAG